MRLCISYNVNSKIVKIRYGYVRYIYNRIEDVNRFQGAINYFVWKISGARYKVIKRARKIGNYVIVVVVVERAKGKNIKLEEYSDIEFIGGHI